MSLPDPTHQLVEQAAKAASNGHAPVAPPVELPLNNCVVEVIDATDNATGAKLKLIVVTHPSGGFRVIIPLPPANARLVGNLLCDRPNVMLPS